VKTHKQYVNKDKTLMSSEFTAGDAVKISDRDPVTADNKNGLFYPHYRGLMGTLAKMYDDGTASITIDPVSLPETMRSRHEAGSEAQRRKWLEGLSDEARNRLTAAEKQFSLRYTVLVAATDLKKLDRQSTTDLDAAEARFLESRKQKDT
jgi:hypothetical protein